MSNLINIEMFFLISQTQFDNILTTYNVTLSDSYFITYICLNIFAYVVLYVLCYFIIKLFSLLIRRPKFNV